MSDDPTRPGGPPPPAGGYPPGGGYPPPAAPPPGPPPGAPPPAGPPPGGYGAPPAGYGAPPGGYLPPPGPPPRSNGLIIAIVVGVVVVLGIGAALFFFLSGDDEVRRADGPTGPVPTGPTEPTGPTGPTEPTGPTPQPTGPTGPVNPPDDGGLPLQEQVGAYTLVASQSAPELIARGATDAVVTRYERSDGVPLIHTLAAFPNPNRANNLWDQLGEALLASGEFVLVDEGDLTGPDGSFVGNVGVLRSATENAIIWTNTNLLAVVEGPRAREDFVFEFFRAVSYGTG
jgi:hypothetical protein